ncbi:GerAB/ArcD/ProY family transporter [Bacillaceae bacterium SIJ1]|uniref:GerAB/ArcD/ProY family transporter n=1 Tax=Litoribacterium kuwaitense TaxID=1398745 RepID=UPI0013EDAADF|nr:GerAB/ArcD/ProY family transporter [Litoribacterium kuwaitense]NGP46124.1 GerAB/ArcD/ProY family transporter [Litoribacterium kuwaitense]
MKFTLFDRSATFGGGYVFAVVNRLQMLYFVLILPEQLMRSHMLILIILIGLVSQLNLWILAKGLSTKELRTFEDLERMFGKPLLAVLITLGLGALLLKMCVFTLGYAELIQQFIFTSLSEQWIIAIVIAVSIYIAIRGMEKTIRFGIIAFLFSSWMIIAFIFLFVTSFDSLYHLSDVIPHQWQDVRLINVLLIMSSLSGPEFLICLFPWVGKGGNLLKWLSLGNALSVLEYVFLFAATLVFFGEGYLKEVSFPFVNMIQYMQTSFIERIEVIFLSFHAFHFIFANALFGLSFYGGIRFLLGRLQKANSRLGLLATFSLIGIAMLVASEWLWEGFHLNTFTIIQVYVGAFTYVVVPTLFYTVIRLRRGQRFI